MNSDRQFRLYAWIVFLALTAVIAGSDLWTKVEVFEYLNVISEPPEVFSQDVKEIIPGFFELEATYNEGAFYGWFAGHTKKLALLSGLAAVVIAGIVFFSLRDPKNRPSFWWIAALGLICGGTIGNLYDRYFLGSVRDWIKWFVVIDGQQHVWPNFNIADAGICVGVCLMIVLEIGNTIRERREAKEKKAAATPA